MFLGIQRALRGPGRCDLQEWRYEQLEVTLPDVLTNRENDVIYPAAMADDMCQSDHHRPSDHHREHQELPRGDQQSLTSDMSTDCGTCAVATPTCAQYQAAHMDSCMVPLAWLNKAGQHSHLKCMAGRTSRICLSLCDSTSLSPHVPT